MAIVFDNIIFSLQRSGGISRFWSEIIGAYVHKREAKFLERPDARGNMYRADMQLAVTQKDHSLPLPIARYIDFSRRFFDGRYIFHSSYFRTNRAPGCVNVTTVHDLMYEKFGTGVGKNLHVRQKRRALLASDAIVCVSEHTRRDLYEYYAFCSKKLVLVIPNGVVGFTRRPRNHDLAKKLGINDQTFFLYVGHRGTCKGFYLIHDALDYSDSKMACVVVGDPFSEIESRHIKVRGHQHRIFNVGRVSDSVLNDLYSQAAFLFFPSLYEGFGIPPLEAMLSGCPVVASNRSSIPEVVGDAALLFDPLDANELQRAIICISREHERTRLEKLGLHRARAFTWERAIASYRHLYVSLLGGESLGSEADVSSVERWTSSRRGR